MGFLSSRHWRLPRIFLSAIALYPAQKWRYLAAQRCFYCFLLISGPVTQLTRFVNTGFNSELLLEVLSLMITLFACLVKYTAFVLKQKEIHMMLLRIEYFWHKIQRQEERVILKKHADDALKISYLFASYVIFAISGIILRGLSTTFLELISPNNRTYPEVFPLKSEYFVDRQKYYYPIFIHVTAVTSVGLITLGATESAIFMVIKQNCAFFHIACRRIRCALNGDRKTTSSPMEDSEVRENLIEAIEMHKAALETLTVVQNCLMQTYFILLSMGVASLSINLYSCTFLSWCQRINCAYSISWWQLFQALRITKNPEKILLYFCLVCGHLAYIFFGNFVGQIMLNHTSNFFTYTCDTMWYTLPRHIQKLLILLMQRSAKAEAFSLGSIFVPCFEGFTTVMSMSVSYFTMLCSTR